ncbi:MATE family efflux transporter [Shewanella surugensis]|uniref:MATE family efflux transporter n=1 Tax=Shewanella surugensis TaxID=212020 RepID=A0ABT0L9M7_9GAMM|nr:MATE family efflux transporter [Shewanella surugensis]MCL1124340.1 MATE family efflux transporter [Shewanella surugensis]
MAAAKFVEGPILKHILVMSSTAAVGISALFIVDLLDMFFLSLLGELELAAAVGYAGTISFFTTAIGIGLSISLGALVSRSIGAKKVDQAKRLLVNSAVVTVIISLLVAFIVMLFIPELLALIGAKGRTAELAASYLYILVPSLPVICLAMSFGAALRAVGDAKLSMISTLVGGGVNAVLDPIFIFALAMNIEGAAIASVLARLAVLLVAGKGVIIKHQLVSRFSRHDFIADLKPIFSIAGPAMLTNVATPIGNGVITHTIADFGDGYVAGWAVIGRLIPVSFGMIFALSGAIGPIVGQNYGALSFMRVKEALTKALQFCVVYVVVVSLVLFLLKQEIIILFDMKGDAAEIIDFFCRYIAIFFVFSGALFVANASFNNLGKAKYSTVLNLGKASLGTVPFVYFGAQWGGIQGVLIGQALGSIVFGIVGIWMAYRLVDKVHAAHDAKLQQHGDVTEVEEINTQEEADFCVTSQNPLSSSCAQMAQLTEEQDCDASIELIRVNDKSRFK